MLLIDMVNPARKNRMIFAISDQTPGHDGKAGRRRRAAAPGRLSRPGRHRIPAATFLDFPP
jgi:hypothetical protein